MTFASDPLDALFNRCDPLLAGHGIGNEGERDLRALARVFDIDAPDHVPLVNVWHQLRPLLRAVEPQAAEHDLQRRLSRR
jgi:hypothetical protein